MSVTYREYNLPQNTTAGGDRVRAEHDALNNIVLPVNSPFWNTYYPPNGWNCRCDTLQLTKDQAEKIKISDEVAVTRTAKTNKAANHPLFRHNAGKNQSNIPKRTPILQNPGQKPVGTPRNRYIRASYC